MLAIKNYGGPYNMAATLPSDLVRYFTDMSALSVDKAYEEVGWFRNGIDLRANSFANLPWDLLRNDEVYVNEEDFEDKIDQRLNIFHIIDDLVTDIDLHGAAYAEYRTNRFGQNGGWVRLHPMTVEPKFDNQNGLTHFERRVGGTRVNIEPDDPRFLYLWMPARRYEVGHGKGVGYTALQAASVLYYKDQFQGKFFENGAINPTIIQIKDFSVVDDDERSRIQSLFRDIMTGIRNAFKVIPMDADVKVQPLIQNLKDMAMSEMTEKQRENLSTTLGVPQSIMFSNAANFAIAKQDKINLYDNTILPFAKRIFEQQLNERFFGRFGLKIRYRRERLEIFQEIESDKVDKLVQLYDRAIMDALEVRQQLNLPEPEFEVPDRLVTPEENPTPQQDPELMVDNADEDQTRKDLSLWMSKAVKRFDEGTPDKALEFASEWIEPLQHAAIVGALEVAQDTDDVKGIFREAMQTADLWVY